MGVPDRELIVTTSLDGSLVCLYSVVSVGKLFDGMCKALVCAAAVYSVLRRYPRKALLVQRSLDWMYVSDIPWRWSKLHAVTRIECDVQRFSILSRGFR